jgi:hypothetical protein
MKPLKLNGMAHLAGDLLFDRRNAFARLIGDRSFGRFACHPVPPQKQRTLAPDISADAFFSLPDRSLRLAAEQCTIQLRVLVPNTPPPRPVLARNSGEVGFAPCAYPGQKEDAKDAYCGSDSAPQNSASCGRLIAHLLPPASRRARGLAQTHEFPLGSKPPQICARADRPAHVHWQSALDGGNAEKTRRPLDPEPRVAEARGRRRRRAESGRIGVDS